MNEPYRSLFIAANYKFSTSEKGRKSSLYFEDAHGNQGRWRREHRDGELLVYQGKSRRLFIRDIDLFQEGMVNWIRSLKLVDCEAFPNYSLVPQLGLHVIEFKSTGEVLHCSGGGVLTVDSTATDDEFAKLANYSGTISDWTTQ